MNYIRNTVGDDTVEIGGETVEECFDLYRRVKAEREATAPAVTDAVLRQFMDAMDEVNETLKGLANRD